MSLVFQGSPAGRTRVMTILPPQLAPRYYSLKSIFICAFIISPFPALSSTPRKNILRRKRPGLFLRKISQKSIAMREELSSSSSVTALFMTR